MRYLICLNLSYAAMNLTYEQSAATHMVSEEWLSAGTHMILGSRCAQVAKAVCKKAYRWSFFFWLDLISTISLLLDIPSLQVCTQKPAACSVKSLPHAQPA